MPCLSRFRNAVILATLACAACAPTAHAQFASNLIVNPGAEAGLGSASGNDVVAVPGWLATGNFTANQYGPNGGPTLNDPGPAIRGSNYFAGGPSNAASSASQTLDVSGGAATIDTGAVTYTLSGYLGGFSGQDDNATLTATFLSASNVALGSATIGPVFAADRNSATGLLFRTDSGSLPVGVRNIDLVLNMVRLEGSYNDGYADNLSLVLTSAPPSVPEPGSIALLVGLSLSGAGLLACRRKQAHSTAC